MPRVTAAEFRKRWPKFRAWLMIHGSDIRAPTSPWELARFTTASGVGIVYRNKHGDISAWVNGAQEAWVAYCENRPWRARQRTVAVRTRDQKEADWRDLSARDGPTCAYCDAILGRRTATIEHVIPLNMGGPDTLANKVLACKEHNDVAGSLPLVAKVRAIVEYETAKALRRIEREARERRNGNAGNEPAPTP